MNPPKFLLQSGSILSIEKYACIRSDYHCEYCHANNIQFLKVDEYRLSHIPLGSVEFVNEFCHRVNLKLPESISYYGVEDFIKRNIREGKLKNADSNEFVKPKRVKLFTGDFKRNLRPLSPETEVWISETVPFESEFRFYIQDYVSGPKIIGWSRYDDLEVINPNPDLEYVEKIAKFIHDNLGPNAYTIDIGWRSDIQEYDVVELNDAWALGYYLNHDEQSNPPKEDEYVEMLISRWRQILFCNIV
jgi:hypothetical protein